MSEVRIEDLESGTHINHNGKHYWVTDIGRWENDPDTTVYLREYGFVNNTSIECPPGTTLQLWPWPPKRWHS